MGCGRVGSTLAHILEDQGHTVAIIDQESESFRRLGSGFKGRRITGVGFDRDVLIEAGIEEAAAFAAVSNGDNSNIIAARVARETFGVQNVAARIYDPRRAEVYQRLGIPTVATVRWTARPDAPAAAARWRRAAVARPERQDGARRGQPSPDSWIGEKASALEDAAHTRIAFISRLGEAMTCPPGTVLQEGDVVHVIAPEADLERITAIFADRGEGER